MSNRLTFSLASLVLILALGLVIVPTSVMAHEGDTAHNTGVDVGSDHAVLESIVLDTTYMNASGRIIATFNFATADEIPDTRDTTKHYTIAPSFELADVVLEQRNSGDTGWEAITPNRITVRRLLLGTPMGEVYTVEIEPGSSPADIRYRVIIAGDVAETPTGYEKEFWYDDMAPRLRDISIEEVAGNDYPQDDVWTEAFEVMFTAIDDESGLANQGTFMLAAEPTGYLEFSAVTKVGSDEFTAVATPKAVTSADAMASDITITVTVEDKAGNSSDDTIPAHFTSVMVKRPAADPDPDPDPDPQPEPVAPGPLTGLSVPAESYVILVHDEMSLGLPQLPPKATTLQWSDMPNLENLFFSGGSLTLTRAKTPKLDHDDDTDTDARDAGARDLIITEVMWARNTAMVGRTGETAHQWIEIYNPLKVAVGGVTVTTKADHPALAAPTGEVLLDRLSNVVGNGWLLSGLGQDGYDDGDRATPSTEFISMYRKERGKDGHTKGHWAQSTEVYLANHRGTPGAKERPIGATISQTSFDVGPVIFNEISNRSSGDYEWFELRNKSDSEQNLKNREIRIVKEVGADISLFEFGDKDAKIPAGGVLLCVFTDPRDDDDHPVATGWNIDKGAGDQINGVNDGSDASKRYTPRYIVIKDNDKRVYNEAALGDEGFPAEFVLILRSRRHNDDVGKDTNIWDIAGYDTSLKVAAEDAGFTNLWPLKGAVRSAELSNNKIAVGEVHRRQKDNVWGTSSTNYGRNDGNHHDDTAWRNVGWSGIGYRRNAAQGNVNGGTPGYPNNALQSNETQAGADPVVITEVMYATGNRANIPQWIELYNSSKTVGVNLDGWQLTIVNHDQDVGGGTYAGDLSKNYAISGKIPPGQTFLLVAYPGRDDTNLPSERIHSLRSNRGELIMSQYGFELTLKSKGKDNKEENRKTADIVGNLATVADARVRNNPQSYTDPAWALPMGANDDGDRISIVRVMAAGSPIDGQTQSAWKRYDMSAQFVSTLDGTSYGHSTDIGSPGHTVGGVLPVSLSKFRPERMKDTGQIVIRWITESELNNAGFNILRGEKLDGEFTKINTKLIAGHGTTSERHTYEYADTSAKPNVVYYYQIQDVSLEGQVNTLATTHLRGNVSAAGKLTTTWGELKALQ